MTDESDDSSGGAPSKGGGGSTRRTGEADHPAHEIIARFGGIRPMAHKLGVAVSTVQGWKSREVIPESRHSEILAAAKRHKIDLDAEMLGRCGESAGGGVEDAEIVSSRESAPSEAETSGAATTTATPEGGAGTDDAPGAARAQNDTAAAGHDETPGSARGDRGSGAGAGGTGGGGRGSGAPPTAAAAPRPSGWLPGLLLGAAVLALGAGGAVVLHKQWLPLLDLQTARAVPPEIAQRLDRLDRRVGRLSGVQDRLPDLDQEIATLDDRLKSLNDRVRELAARPAPTPDPQVDPARLDTLDSRQDTLAQRQTALTERLDGLSESLDGLSDQVADLAADRARLDTLASRVSDLSDSKAGADALARVSESVAALDARLSETRDRVGSLAEDLAEPPDLTAAREAAKVAAAEAARAQLAAGLVVIQLQEALRGPDPYADVLKAARKVLPAEDAKVAAALETLATRADSGVPTRAALRARFPERAGEASVTAIGEGESDLVSGVLQRLANVVSVRPTDPDATGGGTGATLARAESHLTTGDLAGAVAELARLDGRPAEVMAPWLAGARARLDTEAALSTLRTQVVAAAAATTAQDSGSGNGKAGN